MRQGNATVSTGGTVLVDGEQLHAAIGTILASGSTRRILPGLTFGDRIVGTEEAWAFEELPERLAIVGAGASGVEIASAYARLGTEVVLIEALDRILPLEDVEVSSIVEQGLRHQGISVYVGALLGDVRSDARHVVYTVNGMQLVADHLVVAAGRQADMGCGDIVSCGVQLNAAGLVVVDALMRTSLPGLFAIGDIVPGPAFAHKASEEGIIAAEALGGLDPPQLVHSDIPRVTFCRPNVASMGLTEQQAMDAGYDVVIGRVRYGAIGASAVYGDGAGLVKIIGERQFGELLGAHVVGVKAPELIAELVTARALEAGYVEVGRFLHAHPTFSEAVAEAARAADGWLIHGPRVGASRRSPHG